jgi:hypothetical protein
LIANENTFSQASNPILFNICSSFGKFAAEFYKKDRNYKRALIFKNKMFKRGRNDNGILDENFFGNYRTFEESPSLDSMIFLSGADQRLYINSTWTQELSLT